MPGKGQSELVDAQTGRPIGTGFGDVSGPEAFARLGGIVCRNAACSCNYCLGDLYGKFVW